jgi:hypothetical protein
VLGITVLPTDLASTSRRSIVWSVFLLSPFWGWGAAGLGLRHRGHWGGREPGLFFFAQRTGPGDLLPVPVMIT